MANYNYVAPINYKSFSDMNKERLAAKAALDAEKAKKTSAVDKRRQDFLTKISGHKTAGWAEGHRIEYDAKVLQAQNEVMMNPNPNYIAISDALMRMQELGDNHAELRTGQTEYESHMGENALEYEGDLPWGMTAIHDVTGYEERKYKFNNLGLINYNPATQLGDFPNADFDPAAAAGSPQSFRTIREMVENAGGVIFNENGKDYVMIGEEKKQVNGNAFDVAPEGFGGLWNPTLTTINNFTAETAYFEFENKSGKAKFKTHATELNRRVQSDEITFSEAQTRLRNDVLSYLDPKSPQADRALIASAITAYEKSTEDGGTGQDWDDVQGNETLLETYGTPWEFFANQIVDTADLYDPETGTDPKLSATERRQRRQFKSKAVTEPSREFVREIQDPQYDWDQALINSETEEEREIIKDFVEFNPTTQKYELKAEFGDGARVIAGPKDVSYKGYYTNQVEVFDDMNKVIVYMAGRVRPGTSDIPEEAGDDIRWMPMFSDTATSPFMVINMFKPDSTEYTEEYEELINSFDAIYTNALQSKIDAVQQDD
jgi:hypothetical protein